jgi:putative phosphoesterase
MRIAFISDIHGHYQALEAVLSDIEKSNVQSIVCLGDIASLGIQPKEVIERLQKLDCQFILGNHDEHLIDYTHLGMLCILSDEMYQQTIWTLKQLSDHHLDFIRTFNRILKIKDSASKEILCVHGSPRCIHDGISAETPDEKVQLYINGFEGSILVCGHTHKQMIRNFSGKLIINPGSVGSVFDGRFSKGQEPLLCPWAEYGILNLTDYVTSFELKKVPFDINTLRIVLAETDFPYKEWWERQYIQESNLLINKYYEKNQIH